MLSLANWAAAAAASVAAAAAAAAAEEEEEEEELETKYLARNSSAVGEEKNRNKVWSTSMHVEMPESSQLK